MYIERLTLKNFRCFEQADVHFLYPERPTSPELDFSASPPRLPNVNLLLGNNGSGKSSIFKAVILGILAPIVRSAQIPPTYLVRRSNAPPSTEISETRAEVKAIVRLTEMDSPDASNNPPPVGQVVIVRKGDLESLDGDVTTAQTNSSLWDTLFKDDSPGFFLAAYGANRRSERPEGYSEGRRIARYQRVAGLFEEYVGLAPFTVATLQIATKERLDEARLLLNHLLPDGVQLTTEFSSASDPLFDKNGVHLPFFALSDGFRGFVAWIWDLIYLLSRATPAGIPLTDMTGVVIVDEVDLLLHPEWQRLVVESVATAFPKLQFLLSSHSPLVAGTLEAANILAMEEDGPKRHQENLYGLSASQVLTSSYFGLASTRAPDTGTLNDLAIRSLEGDPSPSREYMRRKAQDILGREGLERP